MSKAGPAKATPIASVEELVRHIDLIEVRAIEISGQLVGEPDVAPDEINPASRITWRMNDSRAPEMIHTRFHAELQHGPGAYTADFVAVYGYDQPLEVSDEAVVGLMSRVAVMNLWPFIREAIMTQAARMDLPVPMLGLIKQGEFGVERAPQASEA